MRTGPTFYDDTYLGWFIRRFTIGKQLQRNAERRQAVYQRVFGKYGCTQKVLLCLFFEHQGDRGNIL